MFRTGTPYVILFYSAWVHRSSVKDDRSLCTFSRSWESNFGSFRETSCRFVNDRIRQISFSRAISRVVIRRCEFNSIFYFPLFCIFDFLSFRTIFNVEILKKHLDVTFFFLSERYSYLFGNKMILFWYLCHQAREIYTHRVKRVFLQGGSE